MRRRMEEQAEKPRGLFAGNRSLLIIFIDVVIILIIYGLYVTFLAGAPSARTIDGYRFSLSAARLENAALATLRIRAGGDGDAAPDTPIVTVRFPDAADSGDHRATESGDASTAEMKDVLPEQEGQERVFRRRVALAEEQELINVEVDALGESFTLEASVRD